MMRAMLGLRDDLRVHDNELLYRAKDFDEVTPLYCFDPRHYGKTLFGFDKTGPFRAWFL